MAPRLSASWPGSRRPSGATPAAARQRQRRSSGTRGDSSLIPDCAHLRLRRRRFFMGVLLRESVGPLSCGGPAPAPRRAAAAPPGRGRRSGRGRALSAVAAGAAGREPREPPPQRALGPVVEEAVDDRRPDEREQRSASVWPPTMTVPMARFVPEPVPLEDTAAYLSPFEATEPASSGSPVSATTSPTPGSTARSSTASTPIASGALACPRSPRCRPGRSSNRASAPRRVGGA